MGADMQNQASEAKPKDTKSLTIVDVQAAHEISKRWYLPRFVYQMVCDDFIKVTFSKNGKEVLTMLRAPRPDLQFVVNDLQLKGPEAKKKVNSNAPQQGDI